MLLSLNANCGRPGHLSPATHPSQAGKAQNGWAGGPWHARGAGARPPGACLGTVPNCATVTPSRPHLRTSGPPPAHEYKGEGRTG